MTERTVPADEDAEESLIGALLLAAPHEPNLLATIRRIVQPDSFYRERHGWIFSSMLHIADKGCGGDREIRSVNQITVGHQLALDGKLKACGGAAYLSLLIANCPTTVFAEDYARIVRDTSQLRQQISKAHIAEEAAYQGTNLAPRRGGIRPIPGPANE